MGSDSEGHEGDTARAGRLYAEAWNRKADAAIAARKIRDYVRDNFVYGSLDSLNELEMFVRHTIEKEQR